MLRGVSPTVTRDNLQQMMEILRDRQIEVVLVGMLAAPSMGSDYEQAFNAIYPELAAEFDVPLYPFFLEGVATERGLLLEDGMHPNQAGVERMVEGVVPVVEQALDLLGD
jgi:acyl-CoA thioesterase I